MVSRQHFFIERSGDKYLLVDQNSGNGTFVNSARVSWIELRSGDRISAGPFELMFETNSESDSQQTDTDNKPDARPYGAKHQLIYPREYLAGIEYFNAGHYFEAHEIWEEIWLRSSGEEKLFYQMLIQTAVGLYHRERNNERGAQGMYQAVTAKLAALPSIFMSADLSAFFADIKECLSPKTEESGNVSSVPARKPTLYLLDDV